MNATLPRRSSALSPPPAGRRQGRGAGGRPMRRRKVFCASKRPAAVQLSGQSRRCATLDVPLHRPVRCRSRSRGVGASQPECRSCVRAGRAGSRSRSRPGPPGSSPRRRVRHAPDGGRGCASRSAFRVVRCQACRKTFLTPQRLSSSRSFLCAPCAPGCAGGPPPARRSAGSPSRAPWRRRRCRAEAVRDRDRARSGCRAWLAPWPRSRSRPRPGPARPRAPVSMPSPPPS